MVNFMGCYSCNDEKGNIPLKINFQLSSEVIFKNIYNLCEDCARVFKEIGFIIIRQRWQHILCGIDQTFKTS